MRLINNYTMKAFLAHHHPRPIQKAEVKVINVEGTKEVSGGRSRQVTGLPDGSGDRATLRVHEENPHDTVGPPNLGTQGEFLLQAGSMHGRQSLQ